MIFDDLNKKEKIVLFSGLLLIIILYGSSSYLYLNPPVKVIEVKIFETYEEDNGNTWIWTYGEGKYLLDGNYDFELEEYYRITYQSRKHNRMNIINIEKIS